MKRKIIDRGLYAEMFRQLRTVGIIITALLMIISVGNIITNVSDYREVVNKRKDFEANMHYDEKSGMYYNEEYDLYYDKEDDEYMSYDPECDVYWELGYYRNYPIERDLTTLLPVVYYTVPLIVFGLAAKLMLLWFSKKSSDFYYSLSYSRTEYFTSMLSAILTWAAIIVLVPSLISFGIAARNSEVFKILWSQIPIQALSLIPISLYVIGVTLIAMSVTGTILISLAGSAAIVLMPVAVIVRIKSFTRYDSKIYRLCDKIFNINLLRNVFNEETLKWNKLVYTACIGILFLVIAWILFVKRPAETAENSAVSRKVDDLIRLSLTVIAMLLVVAECYDIIEKLTAMSFIVVCNCIYVLITEKKWKSVLRIIPQMLIIFVIPFLFNTLCELF